MPVHARRESRIDAPEVIDQRSRCPRSSLRRAPSNLTEVVCVAGDFIFDVAVPRGTERSLKAGRPLLYGVGPSLNELANHVAFHLWFAWQVTLCFTSPYHVALNVPSKRDDLFFLEWGPFL